jgi:hypothetical protein
MPGAALIILVSGSVGALALGLWIVFRRHRARSRVRPPTTLTAQHATERPSAYRDERRASPEQVGTAARNRLDDCTEPKADSDILEYESVLLSEHDHAPLPEGGQLELSGPETAVVDYKQPVPAPNEPAGTEAPYEKGHGFWGPPLLPPPEEMPLAHDDDLPEAKGDAGIADAMTSTSQGADCAGRDVSGLAPSQDSRESEGPPA